MSFVYLPLILDRSIFKLVLELIIVFFLLTFYLVKASFEMLVMLLVGEHVHLARSIICRNWTFYHSTFVLVITCAVCGLKNLHCLVVLLFFIRLDVESSTLATSCSWNKIILCLFSTTFSLCILGDWNILASIRNRLIILLVGAIW